MDVDLFDAILQPGQDDQDLLSYFLSPEGLERATTTATNDDEVSSLPLVDGVGPDNGGGGGGTSGERRSSSPPVLPSAEVGFQQHRQQQQQQQQQQEYHLSLGPSVNATPLAPVPPPPSPLDPSPIPSSPPSPAGLSAASADSPAQLSPSNYNKHDIPRLSESFAATAAAGGGVAAGFGGAALPTVAAAERGDGTGARGVRVRGQKKLLGPRPRGTGKASGGGSVFQAMQAVQDQPIKMESSFGGSGMGGSMSVGEIMQSHGWPASLLDMPGGGGDFLTRSSAAGSAGSVGPGGYVATRTANAPRGRGSLAQGGIGLGQRQQQQQQHQQIAGDSSGLGGGTQYERRQKRLARNRESARQSRRRKKEHLELLEEKIGQLTATLEKLKVVQLRDAAHKLRELKLQSLNELENNLAAMDASLAASCGGGGAAGVTGSWCSPPIPADMENALADGLRHLSSRVGADSGERRAVASHQLKLLEGLAAPPHARVLMWLAVQDDSFFRTRQPPPASARPTNIFTNTSNPGGGGDTSGATMVWTDGGGDGAVSPSSAAGANVATSSTWSAGEEGGGSSSGGGGGGGDSSGSCLWRLLCRELGLTDSQEAQFLQFQREVAADPGTLAERGRLGQLSRVLTGLTVSTEACMTDVHARPAMLMEVLTPSQMVRYLCWVARSIREPGGPSALTNLLAATAAAPATDTSTAVAADTAAGPVPPSSPPTSCAGEGVGVGPGGGRGEERREVLRLWCKASEDLSLEEMEWLLRWVRRTQGARRQQQHRQH